MVVGRKVVEPSHLRLLCQVHYYCERVYLDVPLQLDDDYGP